MWTPRRILLLLLGLAGFGGVYAVYAGFLGGVDGLPQLPDKYFASADGDAVVVPADYPTGNQTETQIRAAFGEGSPEARLGKAFPLRLFDQEKGMLVVAGAMRNNQTDPRKVTFSPFSLASYGKPRPAADRQPGEVTEVTTLRAHDAVVEFDREVRTPTDMQRARMVRLEIKSNPEPPVSDPAKGWIVITNNQRAADPNRMFVCRTTGPVFYDVPDPKAPPPPGVPQVWTQALVEIVNRANQPRPAAGPGFQTVAAPTDILRQRDTVAGVLRGLRSPPPTVVAEGMKLYLKQDKSAKGGGGGIRLIELGNRVQMNLWVDGGSGFPGAGGFGPPGAAAKVRTPFTLPVTPPHAGLGGAWLIGAADAELMGRSLVVIENLDGGFRYDAETNTARFEAGGRGPGQPGANVTVTRVSPVGGRDDLSCQVLDVVFDGPLAAVAAGDGKPAPAKPAAGPGFKSVRAAGPHVFVSVDAEQLSAQGTLLVYDTDRAKNRTVTTFDGAPLVVVRDRNRLQAGGPGQPGRLVIETIEPPNGAKQQSLAVNGPGVIDLLDAAGGDNTLRAAWRQSLTHVKQRIGTRDFDLLTFHGNGSFADLKGQSTLTADTMRLWLDPTGRPAAGAATSQPQPYRLQAVGRVNGRLQDSIVERTDQLNVYFADGTPPPPAAATTPAVAAGPTAAPPGEPPPVGPPAHPATPQPKSKQPPVTLAARIVEVWVSRYLVPPVPAADKKAEPALRYDLDSARCTDRVEVHQDPADPAKTAKGVDIRSDSLVLARRANGYEMTVTRSGKPGEPLAEVQFENVAIAGPHVTIDQPNNRVWVKGQGWMRMPSGSDLGGGSLQKPAELFIVWLHEMRFNGERRKAEFAGQVQAEQRDPANPNRKVDAKTGDPAWTKSAVACHELVVTFDKPVYFSQLRRADEPAPKPAPPAKGEDGPKSDAPKVQAVVCTPAADDQFGPGRFQEAQPVTFVEETYNLKTGKLVKAQRVVSRELEFRGEGVRRVIHARGPGVVRTLAMGSKDAAPPPSQTPPADGGPRPETKTDEQEMKLTVVRYAGQLVIEDTAGVLQKATFRSDVRAVQVPTENLDEPFEEHRLPARAVLLRCTDTLVVSSYKQRAAGPDREMDAVGNAHFETDEYIGQGHKIRYDGTKVIFEGYGNRMANLFRKTRALDHQNSFSGERLAYEVATGHVRVENGSGGSFSK